MRWSEAGYSSRIVLTHAPRQVSVSLIFDVRQKIMHHEAETWFREAQANGVSTFLARLGAEVIESYSEFWRHNISEENKKKMLEFAIQLPDAALHRWSIIAGPCPWTPDETEVDHLRANPRLSWLDLKQKNEN